jgi:1-acyl-sn-glycerol-3-phosphate acyltransferase
VAGDVPGIRKGCVAAFGVPDAALGTERLVVVAETRATEREARELLRAAVVDRVIAALGIPPDTVVVAPPRAVRKTSSGKIRRGATRDAYLAGELEARRASLVRQWIALGLRDVEARAQRAALRGRELAFALWVGLVLVVVVPSLWLAVRLARTAQTADRAVRLACRLLLRACFCPLRVHGTEHLAGVGPVVLCANHSSYVDSVVLLAALPMRVRFVAKRELLARPLIGLILRKAGHLAVERLDVSRSVEDARAVGDTLRAGESLLVFPEGTFGEAPGLLPFRLGAFKAAVEARRPVVPVGIVGTRAVLDDMRLRGPRTLEVTVAPPIEPQGEGWPEMVRLRDLTRTRIAALTGERRVAVRPRLA